MKPGFRLSMTWLHRWSGLLFGWALYVIALTGTLVVFSDEIDAWMKPELPSLRVDAARALATAEAFLRRAAPGAETWSVTLPDHHGAVELAWSGATHGSAVLDAVTGARLHPRDTHGAELLIDLHFRLHAGPLGMWLVAACGLVMLAGLVTGIIAHRRIFADFFTFRPGRGQRTWLDAHNLAGVATLPFQLVIAFTGLMIFPVLLMPGPLAALYKGDRAAYVADWYAPTTRDASGRQGALAPLSPILGQAQGLLQGEIGMIAVAHPHDAAAVVTAWRRTEDRLSMMADWAAFDGATGRPLDHQRRYTPGIATSGVMVGLHFAKFGGAWTRWLYFASGLASSVLIATGLQLWVVKREARRADRGPDLRVIKALNLAVIIGLPVAIGAYFAANRLLPPALADRGEWEERALLGTWLICLVCAALAQVRKRHEVKS